MLMRRLLFVGIFITFVAAPASAQRPTLVVDNGRVIIGDGRVLERGSVVVAGDRIISVTEEPVEAPGARRIDASGKTVLPGLVDTHVHLLVPSTASVPRSDGDLADFVESGLPRRLQRLLEAGITTVMSTGDFWPQIREVRGEVRSGELTGPRIFTSGPVFTAPGGHPAATVCGARGGRGPNPWCREHMAVEVSTRRQARAAVARLAREGVDLIKMVYDTVSPPGVEQLGTELVEEIIAAAHEHGLRAYAHAYEIEHAVRAVESGLDGLVHTPWEGQPAERAALAQLMDARGVTAATTLFASENLRGRFVRAGRVEEARYVDRVWEGVRRTAATLAAADNGLLTLGTDVPRMPRDEAYRLEIFHAAQAGLTPAQVVQAATRNAAVHMGLAEELGMLEAGKLADVIVVDGDPLDDATALWKVEVVVKGGEVMASP